MSPPRGAMSINDRLAVAEGLRRYWADPTRRAAMRARSLEVWADPDYRERHRQVTRAALAEEGIRTMDWTPARVARLRAGWAASTTMRVLAAEFGCTWRAVENKARRLKLGKHPLAPKLRVP